MATAHVVARADGCIAGLAVALRVFELLDPGVTVRPFTVDGEVVKAGHRLATVSGPARAVLSGERLALNLLGQLSGVATATRTLVDRIEGTGARILDTRKTVPLLRSLQKRAVVAGGGANHRMGLFDQVLIKDNHIEAVGSPAEAVRRARAHVGDGLKVEVEVERVDDLESVIDAGADIVLLDNMSLSEMRRAVEIAAGRVLLEASGGVTLDTVRAVAETGVDLISVGALTHSAPSLDVALDFSPSPDAAEEPTDRPVRSTVTRVPHNAETDLAVLRAPVTPTDAFYVRSNFPTPALDIGRWTLTVEGPGSPSRSFTLGEMQSLATAESRRVTLECAGNGRTLLDPPVPGTGWTLGGTGTATFTGIPLRALLAEVPPDPSTVEVVFTGADRGSTGEWTDVPFQRALPLEAAEVETDGPLLAWAMNGEPLRPDHGSPLRLVVPGWYAVASVKWLVGIRYTDRPFQGYFQTDRYRYLVPGQEPRPVRRVRVRSLILDPCDGEALAPGPLTISGRAWSGHGDIVDVRVSVDGGESWREARVEPSPAPFTARRWSIPWDAAPGEHELVARARDARGNEQPLTQWWNELGYGNNQAHRIRVRVRND